jgi:hypothetical protein
MHAAESSAMPRRVMTDSDNLPTSFEALRDKGFDIMFLSHAKSILSGDFAEVLGALHDVLDAVELPITEIIGDKATTFLYFREISFDSKCQGCG